MGFNSGFKELMKFRLCVGNPVDCDCELRPLRQWLASQVAPDPEWGELLCASPQFLEGQSVAVVSEDRMTCDAVRAGPRFEIKPDLTFRDIHRWVINSERKLTSLYFSLHLPSATFFIFEVCKSMHHHTFQINQPTRCNNFSSLLLDVYVQLNMFRGSSRPSSGAQQLQ